VKRYGTEDSVAEQRLPGVEGINFPDIITPRGRSSSQAARYRRYKYVAM
jgi:hypothetical protein